MKDTEAINDLLAPTLQTDLQATPVDKAGSKQAVGESFEIKNRLD